MGDRDRDISCELNLCLDLLVQCPEVPDGTYLKYAIIANNMVREIRLTTQCTCPNYLYQVRTTIILIAPAT